MSEKDQYRVQVVIVGAGPTGLAAANLLGLYGIETLLLERKSGSECTTKGKSPSMTRVCAYAKHLVYKKRCSAIYNSISKSNIILVIN